MTSNANSEQNHSLCMEARVTEIAPKACSWLLIKSGFELY